MKLDAQIIYFLKEKKKKAFQATHSVSFFFLAD